MATMNEAVAVLFAVKRTGARGRDQRLLLPRVNAFFFVY